MADPRPGRRRVSSPHGAAAGAYSDPAGGPWASFLPSPMPFRWRPPRAIAPDPPASTGNCGAEGGDRAPRPAEDVLAGTDEATDEQTRQESTPGTWPLGTASATAAPSRMCELGAWKHAGASFRSGYRLWQLPSDGGVMLHAEPEFGYGLRQGSQGFAKQRRRRASGTPGNRVREVRNSDRVHPAGPAALARLSGHRGRACSRPCQDRQLPGKIILWQLPSRYETLGGSHHTCLQAGPGDRDSPVGERRPPPEKASQGCPASTHHAWRLARASATTPIRAFMTCPEKQHGRWSGSIGRANDRNPPVATEGPVLCLMLPVATADAIPIPDLGRRRLTAASCKFKHSASRLPLIRCDAEEV